MISARHQLEPELSDAARCFNDATGGAFYQLIRPYQRRLFLAALAILGSYADAEDVALEAACKASRNLSSFRGELRFGAWLTKIAVDEARSKLREEHPDQDRSLEESASADDAGYLTAELADWREIPSTAAGNRDLQDALTRALLGLSPKLRSAFVLRDVIHLSATETAEVLGISNDCVRVRLSHARLKMREALAPGFRPAWDVNPQPGTGGRLRAGD